MGSKKEIDIDKKAEELSSLHGCRVHPLVFKIENSDDMVVGYLKELPRLVKLRIMDNMLNGAYTACDSVLEAYLIKEESDKRILDDDIYYIGAVQELVSSIRLAQNQFKKK